MRFCGSALLAAGTVGIFWLAGCVPVEEAEPSVVSDRRDQSANTTDLILEELDDAGDTENARAVPVATRPRQNILALDMRIGELYFPQSNDGNEIKLRGCIEDYRNYILGTVEIETDPLPEAAHSTLADRIAELHALPNPPTATRIGKGEVDTTDGVVLMPILVTTERGYAIGELECRNQEGWMFYNFVIDIPQLVRGSATESTPFNPLLF